MDQRTGGRGARAQRTWSTIRARLASPHPILALAVLCWAGNLTVGRAARDVIPPIGLNFWRWMFALAILLPFALPQVIRYRHVIVREWRILTALALSGIAFFQSAVYTGLSLAPAINAALYQATSPLFFVLLSWLFYSERITAGQALGIVVSMAGAVAVVVRGRLENLLELSFASGDLWLMASVPSWALYSVLLRRRPAELSPLALIAAVGAFALVLLAPFHAAELASGAVIVFGIESLASLLYVSLFASVIAFICWNRGVREVGPNVAGVYIQLMPVFGALLAVTFLGERLASYHWFGAALVLIGILLSRR